MLVNSVTAIDRAAPHLKRVVLVTGTKYYGVHLGPLKSPMRETDPRHMPPDYYFDQLAQPGARRASLQQPVISTDIVLGHSCGSKSISPTQRIDLTEHVIEVAKQQG
jgi:hypothetical protein